MADIRHFHTHFLEGKALYSAWNAHEFCAVDLIGNKLILVQFYDAARRLNDRI